MSKLHEPMQWNRIGYNFLQSFGAGLHPGVDYNYTVNSGWDDLGLPIHSMYDGKVVYASMAGGGWGNLIVVHHPDLDDGNTYTRYAHLHRLKIGIDDKVKGGQMIGLCGRSGTKSPHLHFEIWKKKLPTWTKYVKGWSKEKVKQYFYNPHKYLASPLSDHLREAVVEIPDYGKPSVEKAKAKDVALKWKNPHEIVGNGVMEQILINVGALEKQEGNLSKLRAVIALDNLGAMD